MATSKRFFRAGGFVVAVYDMNAGDDIAFSLSAGPHTRFAVATMQVKGDLSVMRPDGSQGLDYPEGDFSVNRPNIVLPGVYTLTAKLNGSRHICVSRMPQGERFQFQNVVVETGAVIDLPLGGIFALGSGTVAVNGAEQSDFHLFHAQNSVAQLSAKTRVLGIVGWM